MNKICLSKYRLLRTPCAIKSHQNLRGACVDYWERCVLLRNPHEEISWKLGSMLTIIPIFGLFVKQISANCVWKEISASLLVRAAILDFVHDIASYASRSLCSCLMFRGGGGQGKHTELAFINLIKELLASKMHALKIVPKRPGEIFISC